MANFSQNVTGVINCFGIQPSTKYGAPAVFGTDKFGDGENTHFNMPTRDTTFNNDAGPTLTDAYTSNYRFTVANTITVSPGTGAAEYLRDNSGHYKFVFAGGVTNDERAYNPTYVPSSNHASTWATFTTSVASWTAQ